MELTKCSKETIDLLGSIGLNITKWKELIFKTTDNSRYMEFIYHLTLYLEEVNKWLMDEHKLFVEVSGNNFKAMFYCRLITLRGFCEVKQFNNMYFDYYNEALEYGIQEACKIIKERMK